MATKNDGRTAGAFFGAGSAKPLVNEHETAARLGLTVATLRRWRWAGRGLGWCKIGAAVRYDPDVIEAFIEAGRVPTESPEL